MQKWLIAAGILGVVVVAAGAYVRHWARARLPEYLRERAIATLKQKFASDIQFSHLDFDLYLSRIVIRGDNLVMRLHGRTDVPPLISIKSFSTEVNFHELFLPTRHIHKISLDGLKVVMPPRDKREKVSTKPKHGKREPKPYRVVVDEIVADGTELDMMVDDPNKDPHVFYISKLRIQHAGVGHEMAYDATLTNPVPKGTIKSQGVFGPWQSDDPRETPLNGDYTFTDVDMSTIKGLDGHLTSEGSFGGQLDRIEVDGKTDMPDFSLGISGHPVPLDTTFHAVVDGTNGNTMLEPVHAKLLDTKIEAHGGVFRVPGQHHRRVLLDAVVEHGRIEDLLRLVLKGDKPPMTGDVGFQTRIDIPPGDKPVADRLKLDGKFAIKTAKFSQLDIQNKVAALSHRGRGQSQPEDQTEGNGSVASNFAGKFVLDKGLMTFTALTFGVPGASIHLDGTYALDGQAIDFSGSLKLQATVSQLTHGWRSVLLKPFDRLFEKNGAGTFLPIKVTGTGSDPHFGVDVRRVF